MALRTKVAWNFKTSKHKVDKLRKTKKIRKILRSPTDNYNNEKRQKEFDMFHLYPIKSSLDQASPISIPD